MSAAAFIDRQVRTLLAAAATAPTRRDAEAYRQLASHYRAQLARTAGS